MALSLCLVLQFQEQEEDYCRDSGISRYVLQSGLYAPDWKEHDDLPCDEGDIEFFHGLTSPLFYGVAAAVQIFPQICDHCGSVDSAVADPDGSIGESDLPRSSILLSRRLFHSSLPPVLFQLSF